MDRSHSLTFEFYCATDRGRVRANNEDSVALDESAALVVLADGMGGYNAGEVASGMATTFVKSELGRWLADSGITVGDHEVRRAMDICVDNANRAIFNAANTHAQYAGMGTTLVVGVFRGDRLLLGHIGDSRGYRWRDGMLVQITRDHSLLQEQIDAGLISPTSAMLHEPAPVWSWVRPPTCRRSSSRAGRWTGAVTCIRSAWCCSSSSRVSSR